MAPRRPNRPLVDGEEALTPNLPKTPTAARTTPTTPTGPRATTPGRGIVPRTGATIPLEDQPFTPMGTGAGTGAGSDLPEKTLIGTEVDEEGYNVEVYSDGTRRRTGLSYAARQAQSDAMAAAAATQKQRTSAKASLEAWLKTFFDATRDADTIRAMMSFVDQQVTADVPEDAIMINIREQPFYKARFKGNEGLRAAGMAELDPADYLRAERQYADILNAANLNTLAQRDTFASLIGGQVSAVELEDRVTNVYQRIRNADQALKNEMARLGQLGNITSADFAAALLTGKEGAASLRRKIAQAEVSTEFTQRGLTSAMGIEELANLGVTREQARQGAEYARMGTQRLTDLASIYGVQSAEIQRELEQEAFKGLESQRRRQLTAQERAAFAGSAGTGAPSLGMSSAGAI